MKAKLRQLALPVLALGLVLGLSGCHYHHLGHHNHHYGHGQGHGHKHYRHY